MAERVDAIIVGGGQAGLATSYYLTKKGINHVVLERAEQAAQVWRNRWDSFTLITPNWMLRLPVAEYQGDDPDGFTDRDGVVAYFEEYIDRFQLPVKYGCQVISVESQGTSYLLKTNSSDFESDNVIIATGLHQESKTLTLMPAYHQRSTKITPAITGIQNYCQAARR